MSTRPGRAGPAIRRLLAMLPLLVLPTPLSAQNAADVALQRLVGELLPRVEALSGLKALRPLNVAARSRADFIVYLEEQIRDDAAANELESVTIVYQRLGLIPDWLDLADVSGALYGEAIGGYFDPKLDSLYVIMDLPAERMRPVLVHEMVHALQHQHVRLDSLLAPEVGADRQAAARAAIEGHAAVVEALFGVEDATSRRVSVAELPDLTRAPLEFFFADNPRPALAAAPSILRDVMIFPYVRGGGFVQALWRRDRSAVPFRELMPQSTEQVLDPEGRFFGNRDSPIEIVLGELDDSGAAREHADARSPAGSWSAQYENTLGQFELSVLMRERHFLYGSEQFASGWAGDRYLLLHDGQRHVLLWYLVWDDSRSAWAFANAYRQILNQQLNRTAWVEELTVDGRSVVRIVEGVEGVDFRSIPRPELRLTTERN